jgi:hypothetical protein
MTIEEGATTSGMIKFNSSSKSIGKLWLKDILCCKDLYGSIVKDKMHADDGRGMESDDGRAMKSVEPKKK